MVSYALSLVFLSRGLAAVCAATFALAGLPLVLFVYDGHGSTAEPWKRTSGCVK